MADNALDIVGHAPSVAKIAATTMRRGGRVGVQDDEAVSWRRSRDGALTKTKKKRAIVDDGL